MHVHEHTHSYLHMFDWLNFTIRIDNICMHAANSNEEEWEKAAYIL